MQIKFWGTRGSIPVAPNKTDLNKKFKQLLEYAIAQGLDSKTNLDQFLSSLPNNLNHSYGGNTSCVEVIAGQKDYILFDAGTGIRDFGNRYMSDRTPGKSQTFHIFLSHLHWDHIMGFPFFTPAYIPGHKIIFYGAHSALESSLRRQHADPNFPVEFDELGADVEFVTLEPGKSLSLDDFTVDCRLQVHKGDSYGYRINHESSSAVYSTDAEHHVDDQKELAEFVAFVKDADLVIFDAMYSLVDSLTDKENWGHSSNLMGVDLCHRANVKKLCLFHHDPVHDDDIIDINLANAKQFVEHLKGDLKVEAAYDGLAIDV